MRSGVIAAFLLSGCFGPDLSGVACSSEGLCPTGQICDLQSMTCHRPGDAPAADAGVDAPVDDDRDDDGVLDVDDNCVELANTDQADEDGDSHGDVCDNCPGIANGNQSDNMEVDSGGQADGVGDACDPRPAIGGDSILLFDPFATIDAWEVAEGSADWSAEGNQAVQSNSDSTVRHLMLTRGPGLSRIAVSTRFTPLVIPPDSGDGTFRSGGVLALYQPAGGPQGEGYGCTYFFDAGDANPTTEIMALRLDNLVVPIERADTVDLVVGESYRVQLITDGIAGEQACFGSSGGTAAAVQAADSAFDQGSVGIRTNGISAAFDYVTVFALGD